MQFNTGILSILRSGGFPSFVINKLADVDKKLDNEIRNAADKVTFPSILFVTGANSNQKEMYFTGLAGYLLEKYPSKNPRYIFTPALINRDVSGNNKFLTQADEVSKGRQATEVLALIYNSIFSSNLVVVGCANVESFYNVYGVSFVSSYQDIVKVVHIGEDEYKISLEEI